MGLLHCRFGISRLKLGKTGQNAADVNGDGTVNVADLVLVAGALAQLPPRLLYIRKP